MANTQYPKSLYRVYECNDVMDKWSYGETWCVQFEDLAEAHMYAYNLWKIDQTRAYTIIQPYDDSCRGGYGAWAEVADGENE